MKPKYIAIEGGEGSGQSTMLGMLKTVLSDSAVFVQEPGTTDLGMAAREIMFKRPFSKQASADTLHALMWGARFDIMKNVVVPAIEAGIFVASDRSLASSYAYNVWAQTDGGLEDVFQTMKDRLPILPDMTIFLDVDPDVGTRRASARNGVLKDGNHLDEMGLVFHRKVREGYLRYLNGVPHITIDANLPLDDVKKEFLSAVQRYMAS